MEIVRLAERPELVQELWSLAEHWPEFMVQNFVGEPYYADIRSWATYAQLALDDGRVVGRALSIPFALGEDVGRPALPDRGWEQVVSWAVHDRIRGRATNAVSALEIMIAPDQRGTGLAGDLLLAMKGNAAALGAEALYAPVRPSRKPDEPHVPMEEYVARRRDDGLPTDSWLRLHERLGGRIVGICPAAYSITGSLAQWRAWTGLPFDRSGPVVVPGAMNPVLCHVEQEYAAYVEPNVWVEHPIDRS